MNYISSFDLSIPIPNALVARPVVSAFTATATNEVKTDIECILRLDNPKVVITGFDRKNLYYSVEHISGKNRDRYKAIMLKSILMRVELSTVQQGKMWTLYMKP